ncbi:MAG: ATP-binding protein [Candidatus Omnitrophica bacterium]|nr:ATP-binding protein [Candidatus Omnitrophota bacterium]
MSEKKHISTSKSSGSFFISKEFEAIIERNADGIVVMNPDGIILYVNPAAVAMFGRRRGELIREKWCYPQVMDKPEEIEIIQKGGKTLTVEMRVSGLDRDRMIISLRDVTMRKQAEYLMKCEVDNLRRLDQLKSSFVSTVSHELRTPLVAIGGIITNILLGTTGKLEDRLKKRLEDVIVNLKRLDRLIINLLDLSRIENDKLELNKHITDICALARQVVNTLRAQIYKKKIIFSTHFSQEEIPVYMDADRIHQVLINLIDNALKFTPEGGRVSLKISHAGDKDLVRVAVIDSGIGIPKDKIKSLFGHFVQLDRQTRVLGRHGIGLGLAISKGIIDKHDGKIWVESEINRGSKFVFTLPFPGIKDILSDILDRNIRKAQDEQTAFSLITAKTAHTEQVERVAKEAVRRQGDTVIRYGEHEVAIILYGTDKRDALLFLARLKKSIPETLNPRFGVVCFPGEAASVQELIAGTAAQRE